MHKSCFLHTMPSPPPTLPFLLRAFLQKWAGLDVSVFNLLFFSFYLGRIQSCGSYSKVFQIFNLWFEHLSLLLSTPIFPTACWYFHLDVFTLTCLKLIGSLPFCPTSVHSPYFPVLLMMSLSSQLPELENWPLPLSALCLLLSFSN